MFHVLALSVSMLGIALNEDLANFNQKDWARYNRIQAVTAEMPLELRKQLEFLSMDEIVAHPTFKEWSANSPVEQVAGRRRIEDQRAASWPMRQAALGGFFDVYGQNRWKTFDIKPIQIAPLEIRPLQIELK